MDPVVPTQVKQMAANIPNAIRIMLSSRALTLSRCFVPQANAAEKNQRERNPISAL
jgi:hypothetical protein